MRIHADPDPQPCLAVSRYFFLIYKEFLKMVFGVCGHCFELKIFKLVNTGTRSNPEYPT